MKILKSKFKKIIIKRTQEGIVIKPQNNTHKTPLKPIKIKKKLGRWCEYYEGRLPYPIECSNNKSMPTSYMFKGEEKTKVRDNSNCPNCKRAPSFIAWKRGVWDKIKNAITNGEDLTDMDSPQDVRM